MMDLEDFLLLLKAVFVSLLIVSPFVLLAWIFCPEREVVCMDGKPVTISHGTVYKAEGDCNGQR